MINRLASIAPHRDAYGHDLRYNQKYELSERQAWAPSPLGSYLDKHSISLNALIFYGFIYAALVLSHFIIGIYTASPKAAFFVAGIASLEEEST